MDRRLQCYGNTVIIYHRIWLFLWNKSFNRLTWLKKLRSHWFRIFSVLLELNIFCWNISTATVSEITTPCTKTNIFWLVLEYYIYADKNIKMNHSSYTLCIRLLKSHFQEALRNKISIPKICICWYLLYSGEIQWFFCSWAAYSCRSGTMWFR